MTELLSIYKKNFKNIYIQEKTKYYITFEATLTDIDKEVFLKVYDKRLINKGPKDFLFKQIEREEKLTHLCKNENVVEIYKKLETNISIIFIYEKCQQNLMEYLEENDELSNKKLFFVKIVRSLANALKVLYENNVIHRDIKPNNIFIKKKDNNNIQCFEDNCIIKLGDFGSSIKKEENDSIQIGTVLYLAPEIIKNIKYDEKIDLWSLGITLYHLYFGHSPYGSDYNLDLIEDVIYSNNFIYKFSGIPTLDILFKKLLEIEPKDRMSHEELYEYVNSEEFMKPNSIYKEDIYGKIYDEIKYIMNSEEYNELKKEKDIEKECKDNAMEKIKQMKKMINSVENFDIIYSQDKEGSITNENKKFINILYYNEDKEHRKEKEIKMFEENTLGTFFFCKDIKSLDYILLEIFKQFIIDKNYKFNLIVTGTACEKVMKHLIEKDYEKCFEHICIFCYNINKNSYLKQKFNKITGIYRYKRDVINEFIIKYSDKNTKPFPIVKFITYEEYKNKYFISHQKISEFYGFLSVKSYLENMKKLKNLIKSDSNEKKLSKNEDILLKSFQTFKLDQDLKKLNEKIINEYTKQTFFGDLNRWLRNLDKYSYEEVAYFTSRFMYSLNDYALENDKYYKEDNKILFRGTRMDFSSLLAYERAIGKIILLTSFTSMSQEKEKAVKFSIKKYNNSKFSVLYYVTNIYKEKWISNGVDIKDVSKYKNEKEVLFQPFSFYIIKDVKIDLVNMKGEIYLQTIGKKEILEKEIQKGKHVSYNEVLNIVESTI